ncbi:MAG: ABC transporter ATP-binding protein [Solirubrobacteraceae bacterium]
MQAAATDATAVFVDGVSKTFHLPHERSHTLKERALHPFRRSSGERFQALDDVSFTVERGEFFGIVGRNGSGKSTLLKCLAGIYGTDSGAIYAKGRMATFIELGVGFNPDLAARDNVQLNAIMLGVDPREARRRFEEVIAFAELEEFVDLKIKNYSSGMLVRLAFATAIQADSDILLIDEVLAVGDAAFQQKCFDVFNRLKAAGKTILFVTHDMGTVTRFCDRVMLLERGRTVALGAPAEVADEYLRLNFQDDELPVPKRGHWRNGPTEILEVWTEDGSGERRALYMAGENSVFRARVRFHEAMLDPTFNVVWINEQGTAVFAVATASQLPHTGYFEAAQEVTFTVNFQAGFAPGTYTIAMNIGRQGELVERWDEAHSIRIASATAGGALVDFPHTLIIERRSADQLTAEAPT